MKAPCSTRRFCRGGENEGHNPKKAPSSTKFGKLAKRKFRFCTEGKNVIYHVRILPVDRHHRRLRHCGTFPDKRRRARTFRKLSGKLSQHPQPSQ